MTYNMNSMHHTHFGEHCSTTYMASEWSSMLIDWLMAYEEAPESKHCGLCSWTTSQWGGSILPQRLALSVEPGNTPVLTLHLHCHQSCAFPQKKTGEHLEDRMPKTLYIFISSETKFDRSNWVNEFKLLNWKSGQWDTNGRIWLCIWTDRQNPEKIANALTWPTHSHYSLVSGHVTEMKREGKKGNVHGKYSMFSQKLN